MAGYKSSKGTRVLRTDPSSLLVRHTEALEDLEVTFLPASKETAESLDIASDALCKTNVPVAFPTETVYGLGADATRSSAVRGIYAAKNRPVDNPLIVHVCSLSQLRTLLAPTSGSPKEETIPAIYLPLIQRFWPGPLTILLRLSPCSSQTLAPEVSAGLSTFGARMPSSPLALSLLKLSGLPLAAPSANASTRPSPTRAEHVLHDLDGRIEYIVDGGPCNVGVESTVVDGLSHPPAVLRPGGVSLDDIRKCPGWEACVRGYKDYAEGGDAESLQANGHGINGNHAAKQADSAPRAPGMKYKHYSPSAKVGLVKAGLVGHNGLGPLVDSMVAAGGYKSVGILRAAHWQPLANIAHTADPSNSNGHVEDGTKFQKSSRPVIGTGSSPTASCIVYEAQLGATAAEMGRNLFHALRELDLLGVGLILVEGLDATSDSEAAAVMNRLSKAAEIKINEVPRESTL